MQKIIQGSDQIVLNTLSILREVGVEVVAPQKRRKEVNPRILCSSGCCSAALSAMHTSAPFHPTLDDPALLVVGAVLVVVPPPALRSAEPP